MKPIIEIHNLGKKYPIVHDQAPYGTLRDSLTRLVRHPFARKQTREEFWALRDINLDIAKGDIVGIIGRNGAGKSTLLKILAGVTKPSTGSAKLYGRISSLLEVGTGFHPELTGRENVYMNGVILGMTRREVARKFDEIVAFAGIERFLDTPVKHYSSGMYVRLAFAVAAHLEPDILIVDEVLAVGDAEFQKKCLGKMREVSTEQGRTVIFVSHDLNAVSRLCPMSVLLDAGLIRTQGKTNSVIEQYLGRSDRTDIPSPKKNTGRSHIRSVRIVNDSGVQVGCIDNRNQFFIEFEIVITNEVPGITLGFTIFNRNNVGIFSSLSSDSIVRFQKGTNHLQIRIPGEFLHSGAYRIEGALGGLDGIYEQDDNLLTFDCVRDSELEPSQFKGLLRLPYEWRILP